MLNIISQELNGDSCFIGYYPKCFSREFIDLAKDYCQSQKDWLGGMSSFGKAIPRLQKWHQMEGKYFSPTWRDCHPRWQSFPYDDTLLKMQSRINQETNSLMYNYPDYTGVTFNSCLLNYYRDGNDSIKPYSDSISVFGPDPTIAILSIGETRDIYFKRKKLNDKCPQSLRLDQKTRHLNSKITLEEGSLLIMAGATQRYYLHEIPKVEDEKGARYSLTFRQYTF